MKKIAKFSIFFIVATLIFYCIIGLGINFFRMASIPETAQIVIGDGDGHYYIEKNKDSIEMNKTADWLNWLIASTLSMITYFGKKSIDYFFIKKEKSLKGKNAPVQPGSD